MVSALTDARKDLIFLGGDGWGNVGHEFFKVLNGKKIEAYSVSHWHEDLVSARSLKFKKRMKSLDRVATDTGVLAYDATMLTIEAILQAKVLTREGVEAALSKIKKFKGVTGNYQFSPGLLKKSLVVLKITDDTFKFDRVIEPGSL
ncbi:MAG: hypothetical protein EOP06_26430 [Proteobacteria bacterium]|nr:MAG: hypothetical protein EOP06_26430 [Pseudomonadota bacterium]